MNIVALEGFLLNREPLGRVYNFRVARFSGQRFGSVSKELSNEQSNECLQFQFFWVIDVLDVKVSEAMRETSFVTRFADNRNHGFDRD